MQRESFQQENLTHQEEAIMIDATSDFNAKNKENQEQNAPEVRVTRPFLYYSNDDSVRPEEQGGHSNITEEHG